MNWEKYLEISEKTLSTEFHCGYKVEKLLHGVIGILTETEEILDNYAEDKVLDPVNVLEEIGDVTWYLAILGREFNLEFPSLVFKTKNENPEKVIIMIIKESLKLLDILKKKIYYNREIDFDKFISITKVIMMNISDYANCYDIDIQKSFEKNIDKLMGDKGRYKNVFSSEMANNRNLENERQILERK